MGQTFDAIVGVDVETSVQPERRAKLLHEITGGSCSVGTSMQLAINSAAMEPRHVVGLPSPWLRGEVALLQLSAELDAIQERPHPPTLYWDEVWPHVLRDERVIQRMSDRCNVWTASHC